MARAKKKQVIVKVKGPDGNTTTAQMMAKDAAEAKSILMRRWRGRYIMQEEDSELGDDEFRAKQDAWIADTFGAFE